MSFPLAREVMAFMPGVCLLTFALSKIKGTKWSLWSQKESLNEQFFLSLGMVECRQTFSELRVSLQAYFWNSSILKTKEVQDNIINMVIHFKYLNLTIKGL